MNRTMAATENLHDLFVGPHLEKPRYELWFNGAVFFASIQLIHTVPSPPRNIRNEVKCLLTKFLQGMLLGRADPEGWFVIASTPSGREEAGRGDPVLT